MDKKRLFINMLANVISLLVNIGISFFLTPYLIKVLGTEAYGFFPLAMSFVNYMNIAMAALNSMAGMLISKSYYKQNFKETNIYFNTILGLNCILSFLSILGTAIFVYYIDSILTIPNEVLVDVKILFATVFLSNVIVFINVAFSVAPFTKNRLDISSIRDIVGHIFRVSVLIVLYFNFEPYINYLGIASFLGMLLIFITNLYFTKKMLPEVHVALRQFNLKYVKKIFTTGFWNTIYKLSNTFLDSIGLLIANILIDATAMGTLALAKMVPNFINTFAITLAAVFLPDFIKSHVDSDKKIIVANIQTAIKVLSIFATIPVVILVVYGDVFYKLWVPDEDSILLHKLSAITMLGIFISGCVSALPNVFIAAEKLKIPALVHLVSGCFSIVITIFLLKYTTMGLFAIVSISSLIIFLLNLLFVPVYASRIIHQRWYVFYTGIFKAIISLVIIIPISYFFKQVFVIDSWLLFFVLVGSNSVFCFLLNLYIVLNKGERLSILNAVRRKLT